MITLKTLHILNKPPEHSRYRLCLRAIGPGDGLLLTENGVLAVTRLSGIDSERCFALAADLEARGLSSQVSTDQTVSFDGMVDLTASAENVISW
ncbi:sulfurtransferase complex subunit TusB [Marinobacter vulgaris]|uniref:Sulfurtransferase complex subunit TusB n=1 Tax=Marinobacter vulgaris TaxID=1928331 RepID=A0A2V3ZMQ4_9GAMM|nr:sulfurtransferase complex subunit TusB [Marinobacter vulgaris]PXX92049.1 sulfurtransferase complex subunit TusB [Marinobacter vulgaris]TSJ70568.1 sulfurtransferase complex subunit TusB [Marinobacter vulgaris]